MNEPRRISILGTGQMGLVMSMIALNGGAEDQPAPEVTVWGRAEDDAGELAQTRRSGRLPGFVLPDAVRVTIRERDAVRNADLIISAIPVQHIRSAWTRLAGLVPPQAGIVSVAKGIETGTLLRPTQVIQDILGDNPDAPPRPVGALSGPTIAQELARCLPATMIAASDQPDFARTIQVAFSTSWMRVYTNADMLGVELAGATKNVIAIAAGILDGLQAGNNAKSALLARGLAEIARLGSAMGASVDTFFGIAGVGDLATTCFSPEGRNRSCGEALGRGEKLGAYLARSPFVVEGVETTRAVVALAEKFRVDMPITQAVHAVLFEGMDPIEGIARLMGRPLRNERVV
ncbi:MAG: NAD(P)H-dependent glycerol-3-phosphate dehydrogenase [Phycisphaerales bacterium]|jgi:glycerol-3-phosphate dehydrogenase (NAD(P)+)|nr:NAD(P)H-dependent glycerol-3-phosphate dehydrogenase [Phycisphaerales bacterium]